MWNLVCDVTMIVSSKSVFSTAYSHMHVLSPYREDGLVSYYRIVPGMCRHVHACAFLPHPLNAGDVIRE